MKRNIKFVAYLTMIIVLFGAVGAQVPASQFGNQLSEFEEWRRRANGEFEAFATKNERDFQNFRDQINAEFAEFMKRPWEEFNVLPAVPAPKSPDPVTQPVADPDKKPTAEPLPFTKVTPLPTPPPRPRPVAPIPTPEPRPVTPTPTPEPKRPPVVTPGPTPEPRPVTPTPTPEPKRPPVVTPGPTPEPRPVTPTPTPEPRPVTPTPTPEPKRPPVVTPVPKEKPTVRPVFSFLFYNTECTVTLDDTLRFSLTDASEKSVADAWKILSGNRYNALINDSIELRDKLNLSDWGYLRMLETMSEKFMGKKAGNEAVLLQMFILTQSGYKVRIARADNQLVLLLPLREDLFEYSYVSIGGVSYYILSKDMEGRSFSVSNIEFPKEQYFSWQTGQPKLAVKLNSPRTFTSRRYPEIAVSVQTNQNLIDYYNDYPRLSGQWDLYALAGLSETVKQALYPVLRRAVAGKSKQQAAEMLLNFVQTAFAYQRDDQQFGYERSFFADENFFYPYTDCEDRSILYSILVKDLLNLEVVLLYYPDHLATAVHFPENINGDYLHVDNRKFIVCDPTYINASVGRTMDAYKKTSAEVIRL